MDPAEPISQEEIIAVAREIERYLASHPNAADSLEGIRQWWLARQRLEESAQKVRLALEYLMKQGAITARAQGENAVIYAAAGHTDQ